VFAFRLCDNSSANTSYNQRNNYLAILQSHTLFEAQLAYEVLDKQQSIHLTTPGIRPNEIGQLNQVCSHISFNSLSQQQMFSHVEHKSVSQGLRVNPKLSFAPDKRFDPCRLHSKLGIDINTIEAQDMSGLSGLHILPSLTKQSITVATKLSPSPITALPGSI
jgi:diaminopimelate decarboxylase